jgi:hypothetical protein
MVFAAAQQGLYKCRCGVLLRLQSMGFCQPSCGFVVAV